MNRMSALFVFALLNAVALGGDPLSEDVCCAAIGDLDGLEVGDKRALGELAAFEPMKKPGPGDWLAVHAEAGQTYQEFVEAKLPQPSSSRDKLYIQPLGAYSREAPGLEVLSLFCSTFFDVEVVVLASVEVDSSRIQSRENPYTGDLQLLSTDILKFLRTEKAEDAFAVIAVTLVDLYPHDEWNFVFGQANYYSGVGVFSFARYGDDPKKVLSRSLKVMTHEFGHMYGVKHCIHFQCLMNGSNSLSETDRQPQHLCPVCLRKIQASTGTQLLERYVKLKSFYELQQMEAEAIFVKKRIDLMISIEESE